MAWWCRNASALSRASATSQVNLGQSLPSALSLHLSQGSEELAGRRPANRPANPEREAAAQAARALGLGNTADLPAALAVVTGLECSYQVWPGANHGGTQLYACMQAAQVGTAWE